MEFYNAEHAGGPIMFVRTNNSTDTGALTRSPGIPELRGGGGREGGQVAAFSSYHLYLAHFSIPGDGRAISVLLRTLYSSCRAKCGSSRSILGRRLVRGGGGGAAGGLFPARTPPVLYMTWWRHHVTSPQRSKPRLSSRTPSRSVMRRSRSLNQSSRQT